MYSKIGSVGHQSFLFLLTNVPRWYLFGFYCLPWQKHLSTTTKSVFCHPRCKFTSHSLKVTHAQEDGCQCPCLRLNVKFEWTKKTCQRVNSKIIRSLMTNWKLEVPVLTIKGKWVGRVSLEWLILSFSRRISPDDVLILLKVKGVMVMGSIKMKVQLRKHILLLQFDASLVAQA